MHLLAALQPTEVHNYNVPWFLYVAVLAALVMYATIEAYHTREDHVIEFKEALNWSIFYITIALLFAIPIFIFIGPQAGGEYLAAWAIEKALSLDNLFVFGLIFASFNVPPELERRILNYGVAGAIVFRLIFILAGFELLKRFEWMSILFGLILLQAAFKAFQEARHRHESKQKKLKIVEGRAWKTIVKILPIHSGYDGHKLITIVNKKQMLTKMAAVIILIELTDILFAIDSVPAVLAVSPDRFIAYSSNVFALLGLRALYFVYRSVADKFWALNWALAIILTWISVKLIIAPLGFHIPATINLLVLAVLFLGSVFVSLKWQPKKT